jgi:hypothetical protein
MPTVLSCLRRKYFDWLCYRTLARKRCCADFPGHLIRRSVIMLETVDTLGWSSRSPKRSVGPALGDGMVPAERAVPGRGLCFRHRISAVRRPAHRLLGIHRPMPPVFDAPSLCWGRERPGSGALRRSRPAWRIRHRNIPLSGPDGPHWNWAADGCTSVGLFDPVRRRIEVALMKEAVA